jgi:hypothetical protein
LIILSFTAGIVKLGTPLTTEEKTQFETALKQMHDSIRHPIKKIEKDDYILVVTNPSEMWEGPHHLVKENYDAVASGVQWKKMNTNTTEYLADAFLKDKVQLENYFDNFFCAIVDKQSNKFILATDILGSFQIAYHFNNGILLFSSHQLFIKHYQNNQVKICWDAVFEYFLIQHFLGNKTLIEDVSLIPGGHTIVYNNSKLSVDQYAVFPKITIDNDMSVNEASNLVGSYLEEKFQQYYSLSNNKISSLLSGGWDSRLITSILAKNNMIDECYTSEQGVELLDNYVSEQKIADQVAQFLKIQNKFIAPKTGKSQLKLSNIVDYRTTYHEWSLTIMRSLPNNYVIAEGYLGDVLLRGTHIYEKLLNCIENEDKETAIELTFLEYTSGINYGSATQTITPNVDDWKQIFNSSLIDNCVTNLKQSIVDEFNKIESQNFVTMYQINNRQRRCMSLLSLLIFNQKGTAITPFGDPKFIELCLSIPLEIKQNKLLFLSLLERTTKGLSQIPSTNTDNMEIMKQYFLDDRIFLWHDKLMHRMLPNKYRVSINNFIKQIKGVLSPNEVIIRKVVNNPPQIFLPYFHPKIIQHIEEKNIDALLPYARLFNQIMILNTFFIK